MYVPQSKRTEANEDLHEVSFPRKIIHFTKSGGLLSISNFFLFFAHFVFCSREMCCEANG